MTGLQVIRSRAGQISGLGTPYIRRDFTYLVPGGSSIHRAADANRPGIRIATGVLMHQLTHGSLDQIAIPVYADRFSAAASGAHSAGGCIRIRRAKAPKPFCDLPGSRVLDDGYETNLVAIALPKGEAGRVAFVSEFLDDLKRSGWLRRAIDDGGLRGFEVIPPKSPTDHCAVRVIIRQSSSSARVLMPGLGHSRPGRSSNRSGHVPCAPKAEAKLE